MSEIHDNIIKSYYVDLEKGIILFNTVYYCNNIHEKTTIEFNNVMGHLFTYETKDSIIFDIEKYTIEDYIKYVLDGGKILNEIENYDFPFKYEDEQELIENLKQNNQNYFIINSSYGLGGWVLAEEMKISVKKL